MVYHCLIDNEKAAKNCLNIIQEYQTSSNNIILKSQ